MGRGSLSRNQMIVSSLVLISWISGCCCSVLASSSALNPQASSSELSSFGESFTTSISILAYQACRTTMNHYLWMDILTGITFGRDVYKYGWNSLLIFLFWSCLHWSSVTTSSLLHDHGTQLFNMQSNNNWKINKEKSKSSGNRLWFNTWLTTLPPLKARDIFLNLF